MIERRAGTNTRTEVRLVVSYFYPLDVRDIYLKITALNQISHHINILICYLIFNQNNILPQGFFAYYKIFTNQISKYFVSLSKRIDLRLATVEF